MKVPSRSRVEIASLVALDATTGSWFVLGRSVDEEVELLQAELEGVLGNSVEVFAITGMTELLAAAESSAKAIAIIDARCPVADLELDDLRSRLTRDAPGVLMVAVPSLGEMADIAPHFTSWAGGRVFSIADDRFLSAEARRERLAAFRAEYGFGDQEFIEKVERHELVPDAELAEWLILLERGDLLETRP